MSDSIAILRDGRLVQQGSPDALYERPATRFVADFLGKSNFLSGRVESVQGDGFAYSVDGTRFVQKGAADVDTGTAALVALRPEKIEVLADQAASDNAIQGTIAAWSYFGAAYSLLVDTAALGRLQVMVPAWRCPVEPAEGRPVRLGWSADASVPVRDD